MMTLFVPKIEGSTQKIHLLKVDQFPEFARKAYHYSGLIYNEDWAPSNACVSDSSYPHKHAFLVDDDTMYVIHKGTQNIDDWKTNINALHNPFEGSFSGKIHTGFSAAARTVPISPILRFIAQGNDKKVVFCGHSKGGAVAAFHCLLLLKQLVSTKNVVCVGFGTPLIGDKNFCISLQQLEYSQNFYFFAHSSDVVPLIGNILFLPGLKEAIFEKLKVLFLELISTSVLMQLICKLSEVAWNEINILYHPFGRWFFYSESSKIDVFDCDLTIDLYEVVKKLSPENLTKIKSIVPHLLESYKIFCNFESIQETETDIDDILGFSVERKACGTIFMDWDKLVVPVEGINLELTQSVIPINSKIKLEEEPTDIHQLVPELRRLVFKFSSTVSHLTILTLQLNTGYKYKNCIQSRNVSVQILPAAPFTIKNITILELLCSAMFRALSYPEPVRSEIEDILLKLEKASLELKNLISKEYKDDHLSHMDIVARHIAWCLDNEKVHLLNKMHSCEDYNKCISNNEEVLHVNDEDYYKSVSDYKRNLEQTQSRFWSINAIPPYLSLLFIFDKKKKSKCNTSPPITMWFQSALPAIVKITLLIFTSLQRFPFTQYYSNKFFEWTLGIFFPPTTFSVSMEECYRGRVLFLNYVTQHNEIPRDEGTFMNQADKHPNFFELERVVAKADINFSEIFKNSRSKLGQFIHASFFDYWIKECLDKVEILQKTHKFIQYTHALRELLLNQHTVAVFGPQKQGKSTLLKLLWGQHDQGGDAIANTIEPIVKSYNNDIYLIDLPGSTSASIQHERMQKRLLTSCNLILCLSNFGDATDREHLQIIHLVNTIPVPSLILLTKVDETLRQMVNQEDAKNIDDPFADVQVETETGVSLNHWNNIKSTFSRLVQQIGHPHGCVFPAVLDSNEVKKLLKRGEEINVKFFSDVEYPNVFSSLVNEENPGVDQKIREHLEGYLLHKRGLFLAIKLCLNISNIKDLKHLYS